MCAQKRKEVESCEYRRLIHCLAIITSALFCLCSAIEANIVARISRVAKNGVEQQQPVTRHDDERKPEKHFFFSNKWLCPRYGCLTWCHRQPNELWSRVNELWLPVEPIVNDPFSIIFDHHNCYFFYLKPWTNWLWSKVVCFEHIHSSKGSKQDINSSPSNYKYNTTFATIRLLLLLHLSPRTRIYSDDKNN